MYWKLRKSDGRTKVLPRVVQNAGGLWSKVHEANFEVEDKSFKSSLNDWPAACCM
jgi:hypothetical protein